LNKEMLSKGKAPKLDRLFDVSELSDMSAVCSLSTLIVMFRSFTFCPIEVLDIIIELDQDDWTVEKILRTWLTSVKETMPDQEDR